MDLEDIEIIKAEGSNNYYKGKSYEPDFIEYLGSKVMTGRVVHSFNVESESYFRGYTVQIDVFNNKIIGSECDCEQFKLRGACKHVAACLINYKKELFNINNEERKFITSKQLLSGFYNDTKLVKVKKLIKLAVNVEFGSSYHGHYLLLKFSIGENKMYSLNQKLYKFVVAYTNRKINIIFGKDFVYDPEGSYFSNEDEELIKYIARRYQRYNYSNSEIFRLENDEIEVFLDILKNRDFMVQGVGLVKGISNDNPLVTKLIKNDDSYEFIIEDKDNIKALVDSFSYILKDKEIYHLPEKVGKILQLMDSYKLMSVVFKEEDLPSFTGGLLGVVKDTIKIDEKIDNIIIGSKPITKIYFDLKFNRIECDIKFEYKDNNISYFDHDTNLVRDIEVEEEVIADLINYHFEVDKKKLLLSNTDEIVEFLEFGLDELAVKYEVFTSEKLKDTNIINKTNIKSNFSIGQDNIMSYHFDLGNIKSEELVNILDSMKQKKKYYHLKNGDLINTYDNDNLTQLSNLIQDMELSNKDIKNGEGVFPKYRAIYLDSLKSSKYDIIETNNLFNKLITDFNMYKQVNITFSLDDTKILRDYQLTGIKWLYNIYKCGFGGILADEMGLGKSIQLIYLIKLILKEKSNAKILIIAPTSLIYNWKNEFDKFGKEIKYKVFAEQKAKRITDLENDNDTSVFITTYGLTRQDREKYLTMNFELIAIDEAQNIKNPNTMVTKTVKELHAVTKLALTGTPLENSVLELWSIFDFIMPGYLTSALNFQKKYNIKTVEEDNLKKLDNLNKQIAPFILRRKKKDVMKELPDKIENNVFLDLYPDQKKLYLAQLEKTKKEMDEIMNSEGFNKARFKILQLLTKLRQICIDPRIIFENYKGGSVKIDNLVSLVNEIIDNGHKILIFTSYRTALELVRVELDKKNVTSYVIDGSVSSQKRMELVNKFNRDNTNVFLIMLKAGGTGLNLTSADVVIHLDLWWNPQVENQATDRTHRIGQKNTVEVVRLICKGTIEERILELQEKKKILSDALIEGKDRDRNMLSNLTEKDIKRILSFDNDEDN
ncbi:MAG: DEAD/DEAH box helicase [Bacilli bacterium]